MTTEYGYAASSSSQAHTFGNVTAFFTDYVQSMFSKSYFKTTNITSTMAYRYVNLMRANNLNFLYQKKPILIVRPRLDFTNEDTFLHNTLLTTRQTDNFYDRDFGNLQSFVKDPHKKSEIRFLMNRIKMYFDVTIIVEKPMEQMNMALYLKNKVRQNRPFIAPTFLEAQIPRDIVRAQAKQHALDIDNKEDIPAILEMLNGMSVYPITYKLKNSTGNDEFFLYYEAPIDSIISDIQIDDGARKGFTDNAYSITFTFGAEFMTPAVFFMFSARRDVLEGIRILYEEDLERIQPMFTVNIGQIEPPPGFSLLTNPAFKVESLSHPTMLPVSDILPAHAKDSIATFAKMNVPVSTILQMKVYRDDAEISTDSYTVNWDTLEVSIHGDLNMTSTYRLFVFLNVKLINDRTTEYYNLTKER